MTGDFIYFRRQDFMEQLLCYLPETTESRYKLIKYAEASFIELRSWIGVAETWQHGLSKARAADAAKTTKKKHGSEALGLHSPS